MVRELFATSIGPPEGLRWSSCSPARPTTRGTNLGRASASASPVGGIEPCSSTSSTGGDDVPVEAQGLAEKTWSLDSLGMLQPGQQNTIQRTGQAMALTNSGDTVSFVAPSDQVVQSGSYGKVDEGDT